MLRGDVLFFVSCVAVVVTAFECGQRVEPTRHKRIINGYKAGHWPWMAHIKTQKNNGPHHCGGSVIGSRWVLTARHCLKGVNVSSIRMTFGETNVEDIDRDKSKLQRSAVSFTLYDDLYEKVGKKLWRAENYTHDVAVIELDQPLDFNERMHPICLPSSIDPIYEIGAELVTIGHGVTHSSTSTEVADDKILREMTFVADEPAQCKERLHQALLKQLSFERDIQQLVGGIRSTTEKTDFDLMPSIDEEIRLNICAKKNDKGAVTCRGDFGSPVMLQTEDQRWFQFGLTTHGSPSRTCDQPGIVNFFANVVEHCEFIAKATKGEVNCIDITA